ncbi:MAG TPA: lysophospholipid acyltransferase family protein [Polyangiaceae bacterium]|nr:lysophospholipid acyltransferase family protein [Polyangiaceae bacterium]
MTTTTTTTTKTTNGAAATRPAPAPKAAPTADAAAAGARDRAPTGTTERPRSLGFAAAEAVLRGLARYHEYEAFGFEHLPRTGPALIAFHHTLATYDSFLLGVPMLDRLGRVFRGLADRFIFRTPPLRQIFEGAGFVEGTREAVVEMLGRGEIIGLAPGGMREGLRSSRAKYTFDWAGRTGFVRMSMLSGAPIVLAACPRGDDLYTVIDNPVTPWVYERFRAPAPLFVGRWGTAVPRPRKLWHLLSEPIYPDVAKDQVRDEDVVAHHARVVSRMRRLMVDALDLDPEGGPV